MHIICVRLIRLLFCAVLFFGAAYGIVSIDSRFPVKEREVTMVEAWDNYSGSKPVFRGKFVDNEFKTVFEYDIRRTDFLNFIENAERPKEMVVKVSGSEVDPKYPSFFSFCLKFILSTSFFVALGTLAAFLVSFRQPIDV